MNNITTLKTHKTLTSIKVANMICEKHSKLLRDIRKYIN